jgi:hypothetical protein
MPHDFADLIADLDAAKADLARTVKRQRKRVDDRRSSPGEADVGVFGWSDGPKS